MAKPPDRAECEVLIEEELEYQRLRGNIRVTAEAVELCEQCEGEGSMQAFQWPRPSEGTEVLLSWPIRISIGYLVSVDEERCVTC